MIGLGADQASAHPAAPGFPRPRPTRGESADPHAAHNGLPTDARHVLQSLSSITKLPVTTAHNVRVLRNAGPFYASLEEDIRHAREHVHIETYIWRDDEWAARSSDLLCAAAARGVTVRVLVDELGSLYPQGAVSSSVPWCGPGGQFSWCHTLSPLRSPLFLQPAQSPQAADHRRPRGPTSAG